MSDELQVNPLTSADYNKRLLAQVTRIRKAEEEYDRRIHEWVEAERRYKLGESVAYSQVDEYKNVPDREAKVEVELVQLHDIPEKVTVNALRYSAHLAESLMHAAKLSVQNRASELSALQSWASLSKEEAKFAAFAPQEVVGP